MIKSVLIVKTHYKCVLCSGLFDLSEELTGAKGRWFSILYVDQC
jgi:hypothetical protein